MKRLLPRSLVLLITFALVLGSAATVVAAPVSQDAELNLIDLIAADEESTALAGALSATGLDVTLAQEGPFSLFAPTDAALGEVPGGVPEDVAELTDLLLYHVVPGEVDAASGSASTALGDLLELSGDADTLSVNGVAVAKTIAASNGVLYVIESVLTLPSDEEADSEDQAADAADEDANADAADEDANADAADEDANADAADEDANADAATDEDASADAATDEDASADAATDEEASADAATDEDASADAATDEDASADAATDEDASADAGSSGTAAERSDRPRSDYKKVWSGVNASQSKRR